MPLTEIHIHRPVEDGRRCMTIATHLPSQTQVETLVTVDDLLLVPRNENARYKALRDLGKRVAYRELATAIGRPDLATEYE